MSRRLRRASQTLATWTMADEGPLRDLETGRLTAAHGEVPEGSRRNVVASGSARLNDRRSSCLCTSIRPILCVVQAGARVCVYVCMYVCMCLQRRYQPTCSKVLEASDDCMDGTWQNTCTPEHVTYRSVAGLSVKEGKQSGQSDEFCSSTSARHASPSAATWLACSSSSARPT